MSKERILIAMAKLKSGEKLYPVCGRKSLNDCFTIEPDGKLYFWYNTPDNSTHIVSI